MDIARRFGLCIAALVAGGVLTAAPAAAQSVTLFPAQLSAANIEALFGAQGSEEVTDIPLRCRESPARRSCSPASSGPRPAAALRAGSPISIGSI
jgi:hypothetical protein